MSIKDCDYIVIAFNRYIECHTRKTPFIKYLRTTYDNPLYTAFVFYRRPYFSHFIIFIRIMINNIF